MIINSLFSFYLTGRAQTGPDLSTLFRNSYKVYELQRLPNGMYRDSKLFSGTDYHPISIANVGIGIISLCIADTMQWETSARDSVLKTIKTITGNHPIFKPGRNLSGYFRHFLNPVSGNNEWNSEYSTIDTDILVSAALFAKKYFQDDSISFYTDLLTSSIDFSAAIANPETGKIYLTMLADGSGNEQTLTSVYNEYMIVAWLAMKMGQSDEAIQFWEKWYASPDNLPKSSYGPTSIEVLSDIPGRYLSSFTHQFNYYLCHHFNSSEAYLKYFSQARQADSAWWAIQPVGAPHFWGLGAGSSVDGYHADAINNNTSRIASPHIIAGFLPVYEAGKIDLLDWYQQSAAQYLLPGTSNSILWRFSLNDPSWRAPEVQGIDYSTMLMGLASLPEFLGKEFFTHYNNFFPTSTGIQDSNKSSSLLLSILGNPISDTLNFILNSNPQGLELIVLDLSGKTQKIITGLKEGKNSYDISDLSPGAYILLAKQARNYSMQKLLIQ